MKKKHKKIVWVIGCRPNYMKVFKHENQVMINTNQHYDKRLTKVFIKKGFPAIKYNLGLTHLGEMVDDLFVLFGTEKFDYVLVPGDTNSAMAGALAAVYNHIPIIHLEAGLRSFDREQPEEINRVLIDQLAQIHLVPCENAMKNLEAERIPLDGVFNIGSNMIDSVLQCCPTKEVKGYPANTYRVLTLHRPKNVDNKDILKMILEALEETNEIFIWPIHPRTKKMIEKFKLKIPKNIKIIEPIDHKTMIHLMAFSKQIVTDSGGMQVESYFLRKPCVTIRENSEWIETIKEGWNFLTGLSKERIIEGIKTHLPGPNRHSSNAYGMGCSNEFIKNFLENL